MTRVAHSLLAPVPFVLVVLASITESTPFDDCSGCQLSSQTEDTDTATCSGCTVTLWTEASAFDETCGDGGVDCEAATCSFSLVIKYKTDAAGSECTGQEWVFTANGGTPRTVPSSSSPVTLVTKGIEGLCGVLEPYSYSIEASSCPGTAATISGSAACGHCNEIPQ